MHSQVVIQVGDNKVLLDLSAGSLVRLKLLTTKYGSETAAIEAGLDLLFNQASSPELSSGAKQKLKLLARQYNGSQEEVVELAVDNLWLILVNSITGTLSPRQQAKQQTKQPLTISQ